MKVAIIGSRFVIKYFNTIHKAVEITFLLVEKLLRDESVEFITGDCPNGVDSWVLELTAAYERKAKTYKADWDKYGKRAGPIRNSELVNSNPDRLYAVWDGKSKGTLDTIRKAKKRGCLRYVYIIKDHNSVQAISGEEWSDPE